MPVAISCDTGSGVWRIASHPKDPKRMACANMYSGISLFSAEATEDSFRMIQHERFYSKEEHESFVYGIDILPDTNTSSLVASCSFYDASVCIRRIVH